MDNQSNWPPDQADKTSSEQQVTPKREGLAAIPHDQPAHPAATVVSPSVVPRVGQTVVSTPTPRVVTPVASETASDVQQRIIQSEEVKEVKRVRRTYKLENAVGVLFGVIESSLAIRLVFKLLGARASNAFVNLLYQFTGIFANPFEGIFGRNPVFGSFELDLASVIGMIIYALVGFAAIQLTKLF